MAEKAMVLLKYGLEPEPVREIIEENLKYSSYDTDALEELQYTVNNLVRAIGILAQVLVDHNVLSAEDVGEIIEREISVTR